jgi:hypothetical protein
MRVWALASCGGLLALAACSADQANTPNPNSPPPDGDSLSQGKTSPPTATPSPQARPEMRPRQAQSARPRLNPAVASTGAGRTVAQPQPQADQLRARLQRLREQQGTRLAANTPVTAAPLPTTTQVVASPIPQPGAPTPLQADTTPDIGRDRGVAIAPQPPAAEVDIEPSGTTADLQPVAAASLASNYPIAPLRHQGQSTRQGARLALLVPPPTSQPTVASARLHGSTPLAEGTQPRADNPAPGSGAPISGALGSGAETTSGADLTPGSAALLSNAPGAAISREHTTIQARVGSPLTLTRPGEVSGTSPAEGAHQQGGTAPLRSAARVPLQASLAPRPDDRAAEGQDLGAIALPESLPLNSAAPRLSPQQPRLSVSPAPVSPAAGTDRTTPPAAPAASADDLTSAAPFSVSPVGHLSPTDRDGFHLVPSASQSPKGLPLAHCPPTSAHTQRNDRLIDGAIAAQPSFLGRTPSMTPVKDNSLARCWGLAPTQSVAFEPLPAAASAPDNQDFSPASVADSDL